MEAHQLINSAIQAYYTPEEYTMLMLRTQWQQEGDPATYTRHRLQLHPYATLEVNPYTDKHMIQVYIGVSTNPIKRPKWLSTLIDSKLGYDHVEHEVHNLLNQARVELHELTRGMSNTITLKPSDVIDCSNQLPK